MSETKKIVPKKIGRPSKFTATMRARLIRAVARGLPFSMACSAAGICHQTLCDYRRQHPKFAAQIEKAVALAVEKRLKIIEASARLGDVNSAKWMLEHLHPSLFARSRIEISGVNGSPVSVGYVVFLPPKDADVITVECSPMKIADEN
ncbi:MAG: hypothetical protein ABIR24_12850 [Verrucomicrobiota bacterium]